MPSANDSNLPQVHDGGVMKERSRIERCLTALAANRTRAVNSKFCSKSVLGSDGSVKQMAMSNEIDRALGPTPMANGPLFAISHTLARALVEPNAAPQRWFSAFKRTQVVRFARSRRRIPYKLRQTGCWRTPSRIEPRTTAYLGRQPYHHQRSAPVSNRRPACLQLHPPIASVIPIPLSESPVRFRMAACGDATFGLWLAQMGSEGLNVTLVNTPLMVSHHAFPTLINGAFGNSSIVLHVSSCDS